jgi:hypothetical protein
VPELPPTPTGGPDRVPRGGTARRPSAPGARDPSLDTDELRLLIDGAHADARRTESVGPALAMGVLLACLPLLLVLVGLLLG